MQVICCIYRQLASILLHIGALVILSLQRSVHAISSPQSRAFKSGYLGRYQRGVSYEDVRIYRAQIIAILKESDMGCGQSKRSAVNMESAWLVITNGNQNTVR